MPDKRGRFSVTAEDSETVLAKETRVGLKDSCNDGRGHGDCRSGSLVAPTLSIEKVIAINGIPVGEPAARSPVGPRWEARGHACNLRPRRRRDSAGCRWRG
eukprot:1177314-Alexandrium_andersonii.AAC.1